MPDDDLLSHGSSVLSSAYRRFTVLFGMGRGGSGGLWSSGIDGWLPARARTAAFGRSKALGQIGAHAINQTARAESLSAHGYGVKPHGQLVPVSSRHYCPSTPGLSTWWSATTLQGDQVPGRSHLQARFPLRCFQRLSLPHVATRQCDWRHNRYTSYASGETTGALEVRPSRSSRTKDRPSQVSCAHNR